MLKLTDTHNVMALLVTGLMLIAGQYAWGQTGPTIVEYPQGLIVSPGSTVTFTVVVTGDPPLFYRWRRNGLSITPYATNAATLVVTNATDPARYDVVVTNQYGMTRSPWAFLAFLSIDNNFNEVGITMGVPKNFDPPMQYEVQYVTNSAATNWTVLAIRSGVDPDRYVDTGATNSLQRFYRGVLHRWPPPN
jgi:hypothetical protein